MTDDEIFEQHQWAQDARLPDAREHADAFVEKRAAEWADIASRLPDVPGPGTRIARGPVLDIAPIRVDVATGEISGGSIDHNRPPDELPHPEHG
jgi:hypothetical protein